MFSHISRPSLYHRDSKAESSLTNDETPFVPIDPRDSEGKVPYATTSVEYRIVKSEECPDLFEKTNPRYYGIDEEPVIDVYGVTQECHSVCTHVWGFRPYFYVSCKIPKGSTATKLSRIVKHRLQLLMMGIDPDVEKDKALEYLKHYKQFLPGERREGNYDEVSSGQFDSPLSSGFKVYIHDVSIIKARSIYGYHPNERNFLRIMMVSPHMITKARGLFQSRKKRKFAEQMYGSAIKTFESNVEFVTRFMIDREIKGMHWAKVAWSEDTRVLWDDEKQLVSDYPLMLSQKNRDRIDMNAHRYGSTNSDRFYPRVAKKYSLVEAESTCQIEIDALYSDIIGVSNQPEYANLLPTIRFSSFDFEVGNSVKYRFPNASNPGDKIIIACFWTYNMGNVDDPIECTAFVLHGMEGKLDQYHKWKEASPDKLRVYAFDTEKELIQAFKEYSVTVDIDVYTGYNIFGFDMKYIYDRAKHLGLSDDDFFLFGRNRKKPIYLKSCTFQSNAYGRKDFSIAMISGRSQLDCQETVMRDYMCRWPSYKLDFVGKKVLNEGKVPINWWDITSFFIAGGKKRKRLVDYCARDAWIPAKVLQELGHDILYVELARLCGINLIDLILRGQSKRLYTLLLSFIKKDHSCGGKLFLVPYNRKIVEALDRGVSSTDSKRTKSRGKAKYSGAVVVDPQPGFYGYPVATLDFTSLYPSIMMAHNLCYSTHVHPHMKKYGREGVDYYTSPSGDSFVYKHVEHGLLPRILEILLNLRGIAKDAMNTTINPIKKAMYNAKQLAIKQLANSVYGFTGTEIGVLGDLGLSRSVTAHGREYILQTKDFIEKLGPLVDDIEEFPKLKEWMEKHPNEPVHVVIYGDTDSVMIWFPWLGKDQIPFANKIANKINDECNKLYPDPVNLEFEKTYCPYNLLTKKRYMGLMWIDIKVKDIHTGEISVITVPSKVDAKGLCSVRRDYPPMISGTVQKVQSVLMGVCSEDKIVLPDIVYAKSEGKVSIPVVQPPDPKLAVDIIHSVLTNVYSGEMPMKEFVITKALSRREEDFKTLQPQVVVNRKFYQRFGPGGDYSLGSRIPYIIADLGERTSTMNAEDPEYAEKNGIRVNTKYYIERLEKPLLQIMAPVLYKEKFFNIAKRNHALIEFMKEGYDNDGNSVNEEEDLNEADYGMVDVFAEDAEDEDEREAFRRLNEHIQEQEENGNNGVKRKMKPSITLEHFMNINKKHGITMDSILNDTKTRLFVGEHCRRIRGHQAVNVATETFLDNALKDGHTNENIIEGMSMGDSFFKKYQCGRSGGLAALASLSRDDVVIKIEERAEIEAYREYNDNLRGKDDKEEEEEEEEEEESDGLFTKRSRLSDLKPGSSREIIYTKIGPKLKNQFKKRKYFTKENMPSQEKMEFMFPQESVTVVAQQARKRPKA